MNRVYDAYLRVLKKLRVIFFYHVAGVRFGSIGRGCKIRGRGILGNKTVSMGDFCWVETIGSYSTYLGIQLFSPVINFGNNISLSDAVHISAVERVDIGDHSLIGSRVYIGDHSHGSYKNLANWSEQSQHAPIVRPLSDILPVKIGQRCWIGDGVVILAGASIGNNCVVAANSVVKGVFGDNLVLAGAPARVVKTFSSV